MARGRSSHRLNIMVRAIVATVARERSDVPRLLASKIEELGESELRV